MPENTADRPVSNVLGFDYGKKRIGMAIGQTITGTASPLLTLQQIDGNPDWHSIEKEIRQWQPQALIVGMPYHIDGSENNMTAAVRRFIHDLEKRFKLPVFEVNEALSSQQAEAILKRKMKITQHNKREIDKMAAAIIVQSWLDRNT